MSDTYLAGMVNLYDISGIRSADTSAPVWQGAAFGKLTLQVELRLSGHATTCRYKIVRSTRHSRNLDHGLVRVFETFGLLGARFNVREITCELEFSLYDTMVSDERAE